MTDKETPNTLFPGRPDYSGPTEGWFGLLHHEQLCERSHNVLERVEYVRRFKPKNEVDVRLHNMIYLGGCEATIKRDTIEADYRAKRDTIEADYRAKRAPLEAHYRVRRDALAADILAYIRGYIPDCTWNGTELEFPK